MMKTTLRFLLPAMLLVAGCTTIGGGDIATLRAVAQGRYDAIQTAALVLEKLAAQPAPSSLTPKERAAWEAQSAWLGRTRSKLLTFGVSLRRVLDSPHPSGSGIDAALATAQLAADYGRAGDDFASLMAEITVESAEDERRVAEASGVLTSGTDTSAVSDSARRNGIALSTPLKTRHDAANSAITSIS